MILYAVLSGILMVVGLWQIEMVHVHQSWGFQKFVMPFGIEVPWWFARDLWYAVIFIAFAIAWLF